MPSAALGQIDQAITVLNEGYSTYRDIPTSDLNMLDVLGMNLNVQDWVPGGLLSELVAFFVETLPAFQDLLDQIAGDPDKIRNHAEAVQRVGQAISREHASAFGSAVDTTVQDWTGEASEAFKRTTASTRELCSAYAKMPVLISTMEMVAADNVGSVRAVLRDGIHEMIQHIVQQFTILVAGVAFSPTTPVGAAAGGVVGGARGTYEGFKEGWESGGFFSAIGGALKGGAEGTVTGAAAGALVANPAAVAAALAWAYEFASDCLTHFVDLLNDTVSVTSQAMGKVRGAGETLHRAASLLQGNGDPGAMGAPAAEGSYADSMKGPQPHPQDYDAAVLNQEFDPSNPHDVPVPGQEGIVYHQVTSTDELEELGLTPEMLNDENGFSAGIYVRKNAAGQYVDENGNVLPDQSHPQINVVMGATFDDPDPQSSGMNDVVEDGVGAATVSPQSANAIALATALEQSGHGDDAVYSGYSLGGRLAAEAAMASGGSAVTFNAAGVSDATYDQIGAMTGRSGEQVRADAMNDVRTYSTTDDPLTLAQQGLPGVSDSIHDAPGTHYALESTQSGLGHLTQGHSIEGVVNSMRDPNLNSGLRGQYPDANEWGK